MCDPDQIVHDLQRILDQEGRDLAGLLERSPTQARERAQAELDPRAARCARGDAERPRNLAEYYEYLERFIRWIPRADRCAGVEATSPEERYAKEVSDRLAHFFWLVDQKVGAESTAIAENSDAFRDWLTEFARQWSASSTGLSPSVRRSSTRSWPTRPSTPSRSPWSRVGRTRRVAGSRSTSSSLAS